MNLEAQLVTCPAAEQRQSTPWFNKKPQGILGRDSNYQKANKIIKWHLINKLNKVFLNIDFNWKYLNLGPSFCFKIKNLMGIKDL